MSVALSQSHCVVTKDSHVQHLLLQSWTSSRAPVPHEDEASTARWVLMKLGDPQERFPSWVGGGCWGRWLGGLHNGALTGELTQTGNACWGQAWIISHGEWAGGQGPGVEGVPTPLEGLFGGEVAGALCLPVGSQAQQGAAGSPSCWSQMGNRLEGHPDPLCSPASHL